MDNNRANQCNPNHGPTGPGHNAGYGGTGGQADRDNRANQLNPNHAQFGGGGGGGGRNGGGGGRK